MVNILLITPYSQLKQACLDLARRMEQPDIAIRVDQIRTQEDALFDEQDADIVIARGITGRTVKQHKPDVHLIDIQVSSIEVIGAMAESKERFHPKKVALLLADMPISDTAQLERLCGFPILSYEVNSVEAIHAAVDDARASGADLFVGGITMRNLCIELGYQNLHIQTGPTAIEEALAEAVNIAAALNQQQAQADLLRTILNNTRDAVVVTGRDGIIKAANNQAHLIFRLPPVSGMMGGDIDSICPDLDWRETLRTGLEVEQIREIHGKMYLFSCKPIHAGQKSIETLITIQNAANILETETKIRKELMAKGLVAKYHFGDIIGSSPETRRCIDMAYRYSQVDSNVLLIGDTGTGKELFAHSIHNASRRQHHPFVAVNCAALPEQLLESELFGYAKGAFSGASKDGKMGLFELAHKGTIFLDEIGEMPISLQAKLLRALQEREIRRIGDERVIPVDVRVITATNIHMQQKIADGQFRSDLYYRINLLRITLHPLCQRREDIPELCDHFVNKYASLYARRAPVLDSGVKRLLLEYPWPGNARELQNFCERMVVLCESDVVTARDLGDMGLLEDAPPPPAHRIVPPQKARLSQAEQARQMGISRTTLWRRSKKQ